MAGEFEALGRAGVILVGVMDGEHRVHEAPGEEDGGPGERDVLPAVLAAERLRQAKLRHDAGQADSAVAVVRPRITACPSSCRAARTRMPSMSERAIIVTASAR